MPIQAKNAAEPIPGYRIRKRIGAGGYGEVWAADAPGGLQKAIKFVYGFLDDERANRELKSLNRVRGVRHPFLLSLERIEVVDGQLLIVTELADTSLKSRYEECRQGGMQGIPREELLGYLKDTADALDYMSEKHSLQHLDVKPENLLLLSGRIKVADFGLVKDIGDQSISMMGGLTPLYASPEVYDGMPSRYSDQYSLAIVYQEMLTGSMPFDGKSAAQLAMQHASADPDVDPLPPRDRSVIRKALSKTCSQRFDSCSMMIDLLVKGESLEEEVTTPAIIIGRKPESRPVASAELPEAQAEALLSATHLPDVGLRCRPTLFLGVGGIGGNVLSAIKGRLAHRFNGEISPFQLLAIDTDPKAIQQLQSNISQTLLDPQEVLAAPLRRPEDYRSMSNDLLKWLSRRWLYNIPRSQQCEGRRPLGRLAMVDHAARLFEAIHGAIVRARDAEGIGATSRSGGVRFDNGFSVVLVGSVSGATGSGMILDLAYACRQILAGMGIEQVDIRGMLPHAVGGDQTIRQLAAVNAYAFSEEWYHFARRGYPGDRACGLKPARADQPPFDDAYLVPIGERLNDQEFADAVHRLAEYLYLDSVTTGGVFFRHCREQERVPAKSGGARVHIRTFGLDRVGMEDEEWMEAAVERLAHSLSEYWQGRDPEPPDTNSALLRNLSVGATIKKTEIEFTPERKASLHELAKQRAAKLALDVAAIKSAADRLLEAELGNGTLDFLRRMLREVRAKGKAAGLDWSPNDFFNTARAAFGEPVPVGTRAGKEPPALEAQLTMRLRTLAEACGHKAGIWLRRVVEHQDARVGGARYLTRILIRHLQRMSEECDERIKEIAEQIKRQEMLLTAVEPLEPKGPPVPRIPSEEELLRYSQLRLDVMAYRCVARFAQFIIPTLEEADTDLRDLAKAWELAKGRLEPTNERVRAGSDAARSALSYLTGPGVERLVQESRRELTELSGRNIVYDAMEQIAPDTAAAAAGLRRAARRALTIELQQSEVACFPESGVPPRAVRMTHALHHATPALRGCGGVQRLLVMIPEASSENTAKSFFRDEAEQEPTILRSYDDDVVVCYEVGQVPLLRAAAVLAEGRRDYIECASRVRTRVDIDWTDLRDSQ
ncbi:MAG: protein kinase [Planctomycetales bacterium]|nr:protein kinase [Planctomycetales bacterium]